MCGTRLTTHCQSNGIAHRNRCAPCPSLAIAGRHVLCELSIDRHCRPQYIVHAIHRTANNVGDNSFHRAITADCCPNNWLAKEAIGRYYRRQYIEKRANWEPLPTLVNYALLHNCYCSGHCLLSRVLFICAFYLVKYPVPGIFMRRAWWVMRRARWDDRRAQAWANATAIIAAQSLSCWTFLLGRSHCRREIELNNGCTVRALWYPFPILSCWPLILCRGEAAYAIATYEISGRLLHQEHENHFQCWN